MPRDAKPKPIKIRKLKKLKDLPADEQRTLRRMLRTGVSAAAELCLDLLLTSPEPVPPPASWVVKCPVTGRKYRVQVSRLKTKLKGSKTCRPAK